jgi:hypothetical protein
MPEPQKKSNVLLYAGIGGGVLLLLTCCCLGGVGGWFFFLRGGGPPEKVMLGKWLGDADPVLKDAKNDTEKKIIQEFAKSVKLEFSSDGTMSIGGPFGTEKGKWKVLKSEGKTVSLETTREGQAQALPVDVTVIDQNHIKVVWRWSRQTDSKRADEDQYWKRI